MIEFFVDLTLSIFTIFMSLISLCCYLVCSVGKYFGDIDLTISFFCTFSMSLIRQCPYFLCSGGRYFEY